MTDEATQEAIPNSSNLNANDLVTLAQAIEVSTARGAFRANELETIGGAYNRIIAFLTESGFLKTATATEDQPESPAEASVEGQDGEAVEPTKVTA